MARTPTKTPKPSRLDYASAVVIVALCAVAMSVVNGVWLTNSPLPHDGAAGTTKLMGSSYATIVLIAAAILLAVAVISCFTTSRSIRRLGAVCDATILVLILMRCAIQTARDSNVPGAMFSHAIRLHTASALPFLCALIVAFLLSASAYRNRPWYSSDRRRGHFVRSIVGGTN